MTILFAAVLAALLAVSCASLRVARSTSSSSSLQDSLIAAYVRSEIDKGLLEFRQTVVEFYPPADSIPPPRIRNPTPGAVKSITRTELTATKEKTVAVDSSTVAGTLATTDESASEEKNSELNEPPTATKFNTTLKSIAFVLALLLIGYIVIAIRIHQARK